jgi:hypothetical protein
MNRRIWKNCRLRLNKHERYWGYEAHGNVTVEASCYKPEVRVLENRLCEWGCSIYPILPAALGPVIFLSL